MSSWPLVHYDGSVFACCSQEIVARSRPAHLVLGDAATDAWPVLYERLRRRRLLHGIRVFGPVELRRRFGTDGGPGGYCATCVQLSDDADLVDEVERFFAAPAGQALELATRQLTAHADVATFPAIYGSPRHADLVRLGWTEPDRKDELRCAG
jgi:hypothetical protein